MTNISIFIFSDFGDRTSTVRFWSLHTYVHQKQTNYFISQQLFGFDLHVLFYYHTRTYVRTVQTYKRSPKGVGIHKQNDIKKYLEEVFSL